MNFNTIKVWLSVNRMYIHLPKLRCCQRVLPRKKSVCWTQRDVFLSLSYLTQVWVWCWFLSFRWGQKLHILTFNIQFFGKDLFLIFPDISNWNFDKPVQALSFTLHIHPSPWRRLHLQWNTVTVSRLYPPATCF